MMPDWMGTLLGGLGGIAAGIVILKIRWAIEDRRERARFALMWAIEDRRG